MSVAALKSVALSLLLAGHATSQVADPAITVDNNQTQNANVTNTQTLNIVENYGLLQVVTESGGNSMTGGNDQADANLTSRQNNFGVVDADVTVNGTNTGDSHLSLGTPTQLKTSAMANTLSWNGKVGNINGVDVNQSDQGARVHADTQLNSTNNSLYQSVEASSSASANHMGYEVAQGRLDLHASQASTSEVRARTGAVIHYSPSPNMYQATAINNDMTTYSNDRGSQEVVMTQQAQGRTESYVSLNGGNMWEAAVNSTAMANSINMENDGGSLVATTSQSHDAPVQSMAVQTQYEYGTATNEAYGVGNSAVFENNDIYMRLHIDQVTNGGVSANADTTVYDGYDSYTEAMAIGNQSVASGCAECGADVDIYSNQVNNGAIDAIAKTTVTGSNRSVVSTSRAIGNSATYYVTRP